MSEHIATPLLDLVLGKSKVDQLLSKVAENFWDEPDVWILLKNTNQFGQLKLFYQTVLRNALAMFLEMLLENLAAHGYSNHELEHLAVPIERFSKDQTLCRELLATISAKNDPDPFLHDKLAKQWLKLGSHQLPGSVWVGATSAFIRQAKKRIFTGSPVTEPYSAEQVAVLDNLEKDIEAALLKTEELGSILAKVEEESGQGEMDESTKADFAIYLTGTFWGNDGTRRAARHFVQTTPSQTDSERLKRAMVSASQKLIKEWVLTENTDVFRFAKGYPTLQISQFRLRNIGAFEDTGSVIVPPNVSLFLGNNSTGKSTILRSLSLALSGVECANEVENLASFYLRDGAEIGVIEVLLDWIPDPDAIAEEFCQAFVGLQITKNSDRFELFDGPITLRPLTNDSEVVNITYKLTKLRRLRKEKFGFLCAYGPNRTFTDGRFAIQPESLKEENEWVISLFRPDAWLVSAEMLANFLRGDLRNIPNAPEKLSEAMVENIRRIVSTVLPKEDQLLSNGKGDIVINTKPLRFVQLSDGYKSLLGIIGHILRCLLRLGNWECDPATLHGIVFIDEVDLHLHPSWQNRIISDLRLAFPNLQLIVTSHSPLVTGSVDIHETFVLSHNSKGSSTITPLADLHPENTDLRTWRADQLLTGPGFGLKSSMSEKGQALFRDYEDLLGIPDDNRTETQTLNLQKLENLLETKTPSYHETQQAREAAAVIEKWASEQYKALDKATMAEIERILTRMETEK